MPEFNDRRGNGGTGTGKVINLGIGNPLVHRNERGMELDTEYAVGTAIPVNRLVGTPISGDALTRARKGSGK